MAEPEDVSASPSIPPSQKRQWLPTSLKRPYLSALAGLFISMALVIEALRQYSNRHHGLVHLKSYEDLSRFTSGVYTYIPTAFAILAVALWNICALDVLRLEPFFQLAKPEGVSGDVLFTNYCFFYGIMAPIMAVRNRHWIVACVSWFSIILRMMLPSVFSGLVSLDEPNIIFTRHLDTWPDLVDLGKQNTLFENAGSHYKNRNLTHVDTFFAYHLPDYSMPPVSMPAHSRPGTSAWGLTQDVYWSEISCVEAPSIDIIPKRILNSYTETSLLEWKIQNLSIDDSSHSTTISNCAITVSLNSTDFSDNRPLQIRHWEPLEANGNPSGLFSWSGEGCRSYSLLGVSIDLNSTSKDSPSNATIFGCTPTYLRSQADINLPSNTSMAGTSNISSSATKLNSTEFSVSAFQQMLSKKAFQYSLRSEESNPTSQGPNSNGSIVHLVPDRIGLTQFQRNIDHTWNRHFVASMNRLFNTTAPPLRVHANHSTLTIIYSVSSRSAILAEAVLLSASLLLLAMLFLYPLRPNFLHSDPGSIAAQCALITDIFSSLGPITDSAGLDHCHATPRQLRRFSRSLWCKLIDFPDGKRIKITPRMGRLAGVESRAPRKIKLNTRPHFLTPFWFLIECILMTGVLTAFGISFQFIRLDKFDTSDSAGTTILWLFLDYGPTVIASMISSLFVSVHRHIGSIEPWVQLRDGMAASKDSLAANFGSRTALTIWKQFRDKKPPLVIILSVICIFDFGLTLASSGMFEPSVDTWTENTEAIATLYNTSIFNNLELWSEFGGTNLISDEIRTGRPFMSWSNANFSFYPLEINDPDAEYMDRAMYTARTRGVGVELQCGLASYSHSVSGLSYWTYTASMGAIEANCTVEMDRSVPRVSSLESFNGSLYFNTSLDTSRACQASFVVGHEDPIRSKIAQGGFSSVFHCSPNIVFKDFRLDFDLDGIVSNCQAIHGSSITSGEMFQNASHNLVSFNDAFMGHANVNNSWNALLTSEVYDILNSGSAFQGGSGRRHSNRHGHERQQKHFAKTESQVQSMLMRTLQLSYQTTFSSYVSLHRDLYLSPATRGKNGNMTVPAEVTSAVWYITPSNTTIVVIIVLLSLDLSVLMAVFWLRHGHYSGPPFPRSIGSLVAWVSHSRMLNDVRGTSTWSEESRNEHLQKLGHRYKFGSLGGTDARIALDHDEKPLIEDSFELDRYTLPRLFGSEEGGLDSSDGGSPNNSVHT